jgi:hypothetical protein
VANYQSLTPHVWHGRGHAARNVGVPYNTYRVTVASTGDYITVANQVATNFYVLRRVLKGGGSFETTTAFKTLWYEFVGDSTGFLIGDVFVQSDPIYGTGDTVVSYPTQQFDALCLAFNPPIGKKVLAARVDRLATIYRPSQTPTAGSTPYFDSTLDNAIPLVLIAGVFSFQLGGTAANIPIGVMPTPRIPGDSQFKPGVPGMVGVPDFFIYVPPLNGVDIMEGDRIVDADGSRYVVHTPWIQQAGVSGNQLGCKREIAGGTP